MRRIGAILLLGYENEPAPTATEASDLGRDAQLEGYELAGQECEQEQAGGQTMLRQMTAIIERDGDFFVALCPEAGTLQVRGRVFRRLEPI